MADHPNTFHLIIASVGETSFDGAVIAATLPGSDGVFTVLPQHEPFVSTLAAGVITIKENTAETREFPIQNGVVECANNRVVVLL